MSELKPCPFCGGPVKLEEANPTYDRLYGNRRWWGVVCRNTINLGGSCAIQQRPSASKEAAIERWNRRAQPAQAGQVLTDDQWQRIADITQSILTRDTRDEIEAVLAKRVPMQQISDGEFAPDAKLLELADKIDREQNWRHSGIFQRDHLTQDQKDRVLSGVMLRRYADLMAPESWRLFPPKSVVSHSYRAATLEAVVKMAERHGIVGEKGGA